MKGRDVFLWVIGGSAGSFSPVRQALLRLPHNPQVALVVCLHRLRQPRFNVLESFGRPKGWHLVEPDDKVLVEGGHIYIAPADYHLLLEAPGYFSLSVEEPVHFSRPSIDVLMLSVVQAHWPKAAGVLLSGANRDGAEGLYAMHKAGYFTAVQDPNDAEVPQMPLAALEYYEPPRLFRVGELPALLMTLP